MFVSYTFIGFLIVLFLLYYLIPRRFQWILLLIASLAFYMAIDVRYLIFILTTALTVYWTGATIVGLDKKQKKRRMLVCLLLNLGILATLKYTNFAINNLNFFLGRSGERRIEEINLIVPLGISFYTFQAVGYLLDVYWGKIKPQNNFWKFALFVSFFPQLVQGPISRYDDLSKDLYSEHRFDGKQISYGLERILWGYFKKLVIADRISVAVTTLSESPGYYTGGFVFVAMVFYGVQLYADFTGGIDITIGISQVLGIHIEENFIRPYFSKSIAEYWRRWHITMGSWFRDYVFFPCSMSRPLKVLNKKVKKHFGMRAVRRVTLVISTLVTWLATGIWHGAAWRFVLWGLGNAIVILVSDEMRPLYTRFHKKFPKVGRMAVYRGFQIIRTLLITGCLNLFYIYGSARLALRQLVRMVTRYGAHLVTQNEILDLGLSIREYGVVAFGVIIMFIVSMVGRGSSVREGISSMPYLVRFGIWTLLLFSVLLLGSYGIGYDTQQFIYNQY